MAATSTASRPVLDRELTITRIFDTTPSVLFRLWSDPELAGRWMGPRGFTARNIELGRKPGDRWRACLRRDNGGEDLWQGGVLREIVEPERLVFTFGWDADKGYEMLITVTFAPHAGKTKMVFHQAVFTTVEERDGHEQGWNSSFDRLAECAATF